jgi:hypothetical protein
MFKSEKRQRGAMAGPLFQLLEQRTGSTMRALEAISQVAERLGTPGVISMEEQLAGLALCAQGESVERVAKYLSWRDFERFCSSILRARGFRVRENITLKKPRAQIDILAVSGRACLAIDCKHWAHSVGYSDLTKLVEAQKARARRLRDTLDNLGPIATVILVLVDQGARLVSGGAVVPIFTVGDFLNNLDGYRENLDLV